MPEKTGETDRFSNTFLKSKKGISKELDKKFSNEALIFLNVKGWINEDLLIVWLDRFWLNLSISPAQKPILVFDQ